MVPRGGALAPNLRDLVVTSLCAERMMEVAPPHTHIQYAEDLGADRGMDEDDTDSQSEVSDTSDTSDTSHTTTSTQCSSSEDADDAEDTEDSDNGNTNGDEQP